MKPQKILPFLNKKQEGISAVLFFGPDQTSLEEKRDLLISKWGYETHTKENLQAAEVIKEPDLFWSKLKIPSLYEKTLLSVKGAGDSYLKILQSKELDAEDFFIVEAGELPTKSKLRQYFEKESHLASIGCYPLNASEIEAKITAHFTHKKLSPAARFLLRDLILQAPFSLNAMLEKLDVFTLDKQEIEQEDVEACCREEGAVELESFINAICRGNLELVLKKSDLYLKTQPSGISLMRALANHLMRLKKLTVLREEGVSLDVAMTKLSPPVFWKQREEVKAHLYKLSPQKIQRALDVLLKAELEIKKNSSFADLFFKKALTHITQFSQAA